MAQPGETKVFLLENATTEIYSHVEKEICGGTVDGAETDFTVTTAPASVTGIVSGTAQAQYVNSDDEYFRKDVLVMYRKDGADSVVDTLSNAITISGTTITFATAPTTDEADNIIATYAHTKADRTDEIVSFTPAGGGRPV